MDNPFERYDLDPLEGVAAITARLKELAADAKTEAERDEIRAAWEELTLHPARRLRAALFAHPETRPPLGAPPSLPRVRSAPPPLAFEDLAPPPSALVAIVGDATASATRDARRFEDSVLGAPLDRDPLLDPGS